MLCGYGRSRTQGWLPDKAGTETYVLWLAPFIGQADQQTGLRSSDVRTPADHHHCVYAGMLASSTACL